MSDARLLEVRVLILELRMRGLLEAQPMAQVARLPLGSRPLHLDLGMLLMRGEQQLGGHLARHRFQDGDGGWATAKPRGAVKSWCGY